MGRQRKRSRVDGLQWLWRSLRRLWRWRLGRSVGKLSRLGKSRRWRRLGRRRSQLRRRWVPRWWWPEIGHETFFAYETSAERSRELAVNDERQRLEDGNVAREGHKFAVLRGL